MSSVDRPLPEDGPDHLLAVLERLLAIRAPSLQETLQEASDLLAEALHAEKADAFLYEPDTDLLVAVGTSHTPLGRRQHELGLHRLPLGTAGRTGWVFATHTPFRSGHLELDPWEARELVEDLGIRSTIATPLDVGGVSHGVLQACSPEPERFSARDLQFLGAVALWLGLVAQRADVLERGRDGEASRASLLLTTQQTLALLEDQLHVFQESPPAQGDDPDATWKANLLRWKIRQLETALQEMTEQLLALQAAFDQSQQQIRELLSTVTTLASHQEDLQNRHLRVIQEAGRMRRDLEVKVHQAETTIARLEGQLHQQDDGPDSQPGRE